EAGAALTELQSAQSEISSAEAEAFLHTTGPARTPKLVHSVRSVAEFTRLPAEFDAHLTVLIDAFGGEQHSSTPRQSIALRTAPRHGAARTIEDSEDLATLMSRLPGLLATAAASVATAGQAPRN